MKSRKLMAVLVMVAMIVTALPLVAFAGSPYTSSFEVDKKAVAAGKTIKVTVTTLDSGYDEVDRWVYFATSRGLGDHATDEVVSSSGHDSDNSTPNIYAVKSKDGKAELKIKSNVLGTTKIAVAYNSDDGTGVNLYQYVNGKSAFEAGLELIGRIETLEFTSPSTRNIVCVDGEGKTEVANGFDQIELSFKLVGENDVPIRNEDVTFSVNKSGALLNKTKATTNNSGVAKVKVAATKPGTYRVTAKSGGKSGYADVVFTGTAFDLKVVSGGNEKTALDQDYTIKFELYDLHGNKIKFAPDSPQKGSEMDIEGLTVKAVKRPDDATMSEKLHESDDLEEVKFEGDAGQVKMTIGGKILDTEGKYEIRANLKSGKYVVVPFEVKEQGDVVAIELSYPQKSLPLGGKSGKPTVKRLDADGVAVKVTDDFDDENIDLVVSDNRMIEEIDEKTGVVEATESDKYVGVLTVTAIDKDNDLVATYDIKIGVQSTYFEAEVLEVGEEEATVAIQFYDAAGDEVAVGNIEVKDLEYYVLAKPSDAVVSVEEGTNFKSDLKKTGYGKVDVASNVEGEVKIQLVVKTDDDGDVKLYTAPVTVNFSKDPVKVVEGAKKVLLTIGNNFAVVDGEMEEFDAPAYIEGGRTYVPFRFLGEAFGAEVDWAPKDAAVETVFLTRDDMELSIGIGDAFLTVTKDGEVEVQAFDGAAVVKDGRTYLPFRAIAEAFEAEVDFGTDAEGFVTWVSFAQ